jgi:hypothetical protein
VTQVAYVTRDPDTVAALRATRTATGAFNAQLAADLQVLGRNTGATGYTFGRPEIVGLKPRDPQDPPDGWKYLRRMSCLVPRNGRPGEQARRWLADHQPPPRAVDILGDHGAPTSISMPDGFGRIRICPPAVLITEVTGRTVHLLYEADPAERAAVGRSFSSGPDVPDDRWEQEPLSAWHLALEAEEARTATKEARA